MLVLMLAVTFFWLGMALAPALLQSLGETQVNANCATVTDVFQQGNCTLLDLQGPLFIGVIFALAGAILGGQLDIG